MSNGVLWSTLFEGDEDNVRHVLYGSILWRDWDFNNTSLTGFSPFGDDGNLVDTLFDSDNPGGPWFDSGYLDERGVDFDQKLTAKSTQVMQSRRPIRYDFTDDIEEVSARLMESNPVNDALRDNRPLSDLDSIGTIGYSTASPVERDIYWRQLMVIGVDGRSGLNYYIVRAYPRVLITDLGKTNWSPESSDSLPIKVEATPCPYTIPPNGLNPGSPRILFRDGPAWRAQGGPVLWPTSQVAPVATPESGETATVVFQEPTTPNTPFTYVLTADNVTTSSSAAATLNVTTPYTTNSEGQVTANVIDLTGSDNYTFTVVATGANGQLSVASLASNNITAED